MKGYLNNSYFSPTTPINVGIEEKNYITRQKKGAENFCTVWQKFSVEYKNEKETESKETQMLQMW
jgi:hypothetical protein